MNSKYIRPVILVTAVVVIAAMIGLAISRASGDIAGLEAEAGASQDLVVTDNAASSGASIEFTEPDPPNDQPLVIYDTDMGPDIDDALALAMLHEYRSQGMIELAAVTISRNSTVGARYADVINTHYNRGTIPIGMYYGGTGRDGSQGDSYSGIENSYSNDIRQPIEDGYKTIRRVLNRAEAENRRVIIIQTGFSGNLSRLVDSGGDEISSKNGLDLIRSRVDLLGIMAGRINSSQVEFNIVQDLPSARNLFTKWPVDMVLSDWAIGGNVVYPYTDGIRNNIPGNHPVRRAYETNTFFDWHPRNNDGNGFYNMWSWDLTSVLDAIEPDANYFGRSQRGTISVSGSGVTTFSTSSSGKHRYLTLPSNKQRTINRMIDLVR